MKLLTLAALLAVALGTTACGDKPQVQGTRTVGTPAYKGTGTAYVASGWKQGDATSWESHTHARALNGQNEYARLAAK